MAGLGASLITFTPSTLIRSAQLITELVTTARNCIMYSVSAV